MAEPTPPDGNARRKPVETDCLKPDASESVAIEQWRKVFEECESGLRAFLAGRLGQQSDVEDCLQTVCVKMVLQARQSQQVRPVARRAWLFRVAANEAAATWRRKASTQRMIDRHGGTDTVQSDPTEQIIRAEMVGEIRRAMEKLPEPMRIVVQLRMHEGLTFQQIADRLQIPLGTALTRMRRALALLKEQTNWNDS